MSSGDSVANRFAADQDEYGADTMTEIHIVGRITLNLWRVMKTQASFLVPSPHSLGTNKGKPVYR